MLADSWRKEGSTLGSRDLQEQRPGDGKLWARWAIARLPVSEGTGCVRARGGTEAGQAGGDQIREGLDCR